MSIAQAIEHTRLAADTTPKDVETACRDAVAIECAGVCIPPCYVEQAAAALRDSSVRVVTVIGFPLGASGVRTDTHAAVVAAEQGAHEIDMVIPIGLALVGDFGAVERHVAAVRAAIPDSVLKVILETAFFAPQAIETLARAAVAGGADYLKTSTGFGPRGASVEDVQILSRVAAESPSQVLVKASGGIRTLVQARQMLLAGATRLGTSRGVEIVAQEHPTLTGVAP